VCVVTRSLADDDESRRPYCKLVAGLLRDIGVVKCQLGYMAAGCQLLHESAGLYQWMPSSEKAELTTHDIMKIAEVFSISARITLLLFFSSDFLCSTVFVLVDWFH